MKKGQILCTQKVVKLNQKIAFSTQAIRSLAIGSLLAFGLVNPSFSYTPDGSVPKTLDKHMPSSWDLDTLSKRIWVAPDGNGDGSSEISPLGVIQNAIDIATPGTAILVKAGTYTENIAIKSNALNGTDTSPIFLVSVDGIEAATIQSIIDDGTIEAHRKNNWGIIGFNIIGSATSGDNSPVKIGATNMNKGIQSYNWFLAGNRFSGRGRDGTKFYKTRNVFGFGNTYTGDWVEEACDQVAIGVHNVSGDDNQFAFNTVRGSSGYTAITMKFGTNNYLLFNNDFQIDTGHTVVRMGGDGAIENAITTVPSESAFTPYSASKIKVLFNRFSADAGTSIELYGARNCLVSFNDLNDPATVYAMEDAFAEIGFNANATGPYISYTPIENRITNNKINFERLTSMLDKLIYESKYTMEGNDSSVPFDYSVGATHVAPLLESFIADLSGNSSSSSIPLLVNTDFDNGDDNAWELFNYAENHIQNNETYNGSPFAISITPNSNYRIIEQSNINVIPGETISASAYMKMVNFKDSETADVVIEYFDTDSGGTHNGSISNPRKIYTDTVASVFSTVNNDWQKFTNTFIVPDDTEYLRVRIRSQPTKTGTVFFDNVQVNAITDAQL